MNDIDTVEMTKLAYAMEEAYKRYRTQGEAIESVKNKYPDADLNVLWAMWLSIDAYIDINEGSVEV